MASPARVVVVGFDAADPGIVLTLAAEGRLPNVRALVDAGLGVETVNPVGVFVGAVWPSMYTGVSPGRHGRYGPGRFRPGTYEVHRSHASDVPQDPFWAALARDGRRSAVLDVPHTRMIPMGEGVQVADWGGHDRSVPMRTWPRSLGGEITNRFGRYPVEDCDDFSRRRALPALHQHLLTGVERKSELAEFLLRQGDWELFLVVFAESHCVGHQCWHVHDPGHPQHDAELAETIGDPIVDVYQALDRALGRLVACLGDDATVLLLLSHGMGPHYDATFMLSEILARLDRAEGATPHSVVVRERLRRAARRASLAARRRLGVSADEVMRFCDGSRRFFRAPNSTPYGAVRINLEGREPAGRVAPGRQHEELCSSLERELLALVNLETGAPVARRVLRSRDLYDGPALETMPDLLIEWNWDTPVRSVASPTIGRIDGEDTGNRTGDHRQNGFLLARGPSIPGGRLADPIAVTDVAPTIGALLGVTIPESEGRAVLPIAS